MQFELLVSRGSDALSLNLETGDIRDGSIWPVQSQNPLNDYSITLPEAESVVQGQTLRTQVEFDIRSFQVLLKLPSGPWEKVLESPGLQELRRYFLRTLLLKWHDEQATDPMSNDARIIYGLVKDEVRRIEGR